MHAGESAINKGLANRLAELEVEREERDRAELEEECGIEADTYEALPDPAEDATEGLRHDVNNLTHFVDRLSIRCEDFFRRNAGLEEARKREMHDEERRARLACVDALQALRDGVGAARGVEGVQRGAHHWLCFQRQQLPVDPSMPPCLLCRCPVALSLPLALARSLLLYVLHAI